MYSKDTENLLVFVWFSIDFHRGLGLNCENTNIKMKLYFPELTFYSHEFTARISALGLPLISGKFAVNSTTCKYIQTGSHKAVMLN